VLASFVARSARHPAPVIELGLLRVRSFAVANAGVFLFALGFYAVLLANILFLTSVWGWSVLRAGIAVTPGPLMAALSATVGGRLADRYGQRVVALPGGLLFAAGCVVFATATGATPHYASEFLPATLLTGTGVGLSFAAWGSAAVAELPPSRFATGSAISATSRQIGAVLGIAVLVAVIGTPRPEDAVSTFHTAWVLMAIPATAAGLVALALGRVRARNPEAAVAMAAVEA
jgi:MFS family permease